MGYGYFDGHEHGGYFPEIDEDLFSARNTILKPLQPPQKAEKPTYVEEAIDHSAITDQPDENQLPENIQEA